MAVSEITSPRLFMLSGNPVIAKLQADDSITGTDVLAVHRLDFVARADVGETMTISVLNGRYELVFTSVNLPDNSGKQFRYLGLTAPDLSYATNVKGWLLFNYLIDTYYTISAGNSYLIITAKYPGEEFNVEFIDADFSHTTTGLVSGALAEQKSSFALESILYIYENLSWNIVLDEGDMVVPNSDGIAVFNFQELIKAKLDALQEGELNLHYPDYSSIDWIYQQDNLIRKFKYSFTEFYGSPYLPEYIIQESNEFYCLPGGYSKEKLSGMNASGDSFYNRLQNDRMFLSWQNTTKKYHYAQFVRFFYCNIESTARISLRAQPYFKDGYLPTTQTVFYITAPDQYSILEIIASPQLMIDLFGLLPAGDILTKVRIWLEDEFGNRISEYRTLIIDHEQHENVRYFMFLNSYGVFETIYTTGLGVKGNDYERITIDKQLQYDFDHINHETIDDKVFETDVQKVNTGYQCNKGEIDRLRDFVISNRIYEIIDGFIIPIKLLTNKIVTVKDNQFYYEIEFDYRRGYKSEFYSINNYTAIIPKAAKFTPSDITEFTHEFTTK